MALPSKVSFAVVQGILNGAGATGPVHWLATPYGRPQVNNALVFTASQFMDDQLMFYLLAKAYEVRPSREAMLWIYERFVKPPKADGKVTVSANLNDASRTVNILAKDADRTFELVTGAWARTLPGGAHPRAFGDAITSMRLLLSDIDNRFRYEIGRDRGRNAAPVEFTAYAGRLRLLEEELALMRQDSARMPATKGEATMKALVALAALAAPLAYAQPNIEAGKAKVATVCAACHGLNGVSVSDTIPNLAAQRAPYIEAQLKAFKDGLRKPAGLVSPTATMAAIATQLSAEDIVNVAAYFAAQPGASQVTQKSSFLPNVAKTHVTFPDDYKTSFVKYHTISFPATRQVRYYYANKAAVDAAKAGKPLPVGSYLFAEVYSAKLDANKQPVMGKDGFFEPEKLLFYTAMQSGPGWGQDIPDMLRNADWNYGIFTLEKQHRPGVNQAECFACHKPLDNVSYVFTLKQLGAAGK